MRSKEASSDTSAEGLRLPAAGLGTTPHRSEAAASPPTPAHELQKLGGGPEYREGPAAFPGCCGHRRAPLGSGGGEGGPLPGQVPAGERGVGSGSRSWRWAGAPRSVPSGLGIISFRRGANPIGPGPSAS